MDDNEIIKECYTLLQVSKREREKALGRPLNDQDVKDLQSAVATLFQVGGIKAVRAGITQLAKLCEQVKNERYNN